MTYLMATLHYFSARKEFAFQKASLPIFYMHFSSTVPELHIQPIKIYLVLLLLLFIIIIIIPTILENQHKLRRPALCNALNSHYTSSLPDPNLSLSSLAFIHLFITEVFPETRSQHFTDKQNCLYNHHFM